MNILVIAAHPDDEVLGMGGTISKYRKLGHKVKIVIMATGIASRRSTNFKNNPNYEIKKSDNKKMISFLHMLNIQNLWRSYYHLFLKFKMN